MEFSLFTVILIGLGTMFFGYFFGLFEGRGQGRKRAAAEMQSLKAEVPPPVVRDDPGLLRLKDVNGRFQVEMDGAPVPLESISSEQRKRLIELVTRLRPLIEARTAASVAPVQPAAAASPPRAVAPTPTQPAAPGAPAQSGANDEPPAPRSMVAQIDTILQGKLAGTPLSQRGIRLEESLGGGVTVIVGLQRFAGVGDVPDPEVQAVIRAAIAEWEKKFTPGL